ncbi:hypothetical protein INR49_017239, partial [Caranx melampygus]
MSADRTEIPAGGSVTLTCSVDRPDGLSYSLLINGESNPVFSVSQGGVYSCRGWRPETRDLTGLSDSVTIYETVSSRVTVTLLPNWSVMYRGEKITVRCEIQRGGDTEWTYEWRTTSSYKPPSLREFTINSVTKSHSGDYSCKGRRDYLLTQWSGVRTLTVSGNKPTATLTPGSTEIPAGGRVTLYCYVDQSNSWKYSWFRRTSDSSTSQTVGETDRSTRDITQGGIYTCRGRRGEPELNTQESNKVTIKET